MILASESQTRMEHKSELPQELKSFFSSASYEALEAKLQPFCSLALRRLADPLPRPFPARTPTDVIRNNFIDSLPEYGEPLETVAARLRDHVIPHCSNKRAPRYFAQMDIPPADLSVFSGLLIRSLAQDPIALSSSRSGTFVEKQVIQWLGSLIFPQDQLRGGIITSGGTHSNLHALLLLRNSTFRSLGVDFSTLGMLEALRITKKSGITFLVSEVAHESIFSAVRYLGLGSGGAMLVKTNCSEEMVIDDLRSKLETARANSMIVAGVVLTACTTGSGAVDPLRRAIAVADEFGVPVHVDAAHGGMLLFSSRYRGILSGIERATTVTIDPHKILGLNQSLGFLSVRSSELLGELGKVGLEYYCPGDERDLGDYTIDNSRSFNSLGAWIVLRALGKQGYELIVDHLMTLSEVFRDRLREHEYFEILSEAPMNVVAFRLTRGVGETLKSQNEAALALLSDTLEGGEFAISRYGRRNGETYLRAVFVNPASAIEDVHALSDRLIAKAQRYLY